MPTPVLSLVANDTEPLRLIFETSPGVPVDITGWGIKLHLGYATPLVLTGTLTTPLSGLASVAFVSGNLVAGKWKAEVQITKPGTLIQTSEMFIADIRSEIA